MLFLALSRFVSLPLSPHLSLSLFLSLSLSLSLFLSVTQMRRVGVSRSDPVPLSVSWVLAYVKLPINIYDIYIYGWRR